MKLLFSKNNLIDGINIVMKAVPSKTTMTILECILIDASGTDITLTANDMELGIETKVEGEIKEHGKIALNARLFSDIVRKLSGEDFFITIESDEKLSTVISCDKAVFRIQGRDGEEFSYIPHIERKKYISLSEYSLKEVIRQTLFSISPNDSNKMMTGELFQCEEDVLTVVSLDGHRMSTRKITLKDNYGNFKVIIPGKSLSEISRILEGDNESEVLVFFDQNHAMFEFADTIVITRLIEGEYFRVSQMISRDYSLKVTVNRRELLDSIERASILVRENDKKPIVFHFTGDMMKLRMNSAFGSMNAEIPVIKQGDDLMIGFNPNFFIDALRIIDDEEVTLYMLNAKSPCYIKNDEESYIYLILPVNFNASSI